MKKKGFYSFFILSVVLILLFTQNYSFVTQAQKSVTAEKIFEEFNQKLSFFLVDFLTFFKMQNLSGSETTELSAGSGTSSDNIHVTYQDGFTYESVPESIRALMYGNSYKTDCTIPWTDLNYVKVKYYNFDQEIVDGEIICNKSIAQDLVEIFYDLYCNHYEIEEICLIDYYQADDELSMEHNNTSCFNYRTVPGSTKMSKHSQGLAIDINPFYNPYIKYNSEGNMLITPIGSETYADRTNDFPHKITTNDLCYKLFTEHDFTWGGNWKNNKDYQHFQKDE